MSAPSTLEPHVLETGHVAIALDVRLEEGLSGAEAARRLSREGPNRLTGRAPVPAWRRLAAQATNVMTLMLLLAAIVAAALGDWLDAVVIGAVVAFNTILGFYQEQRAEHALAALERMLPTRGRVRRGGAVQACDAEDLVVGDVVLLEAGDRIPADGRIFVAHALEVDEAVLTGESAPVAKHARALGAEETALADRANMVWMNTTVTRGRGEVVISATGMRTEVGRLAALLEDAGDRTTPLQRQLDRLGRRLAAISGAIIVLIVAAGLLSGRDAAATFMTAVALAVAAIPEGMPAVVTVTLALGMHRMARKQAILRHMAAVETLGCASVICSDKTGTLTRGEMEVQDLWVAGERKGAEDAGGAVALLQALVACNEAHLRDGVALGDPTEAALLRLGARHGVCRGALEEQLPRIAEIPFDSDRKYMATVHAEAGGPLVFVKGAPEVVLERCATWMGPDGRPRGLDAEVLVRLLETSLAMADDGQRVLAAARGPLPEGGVWSIDGCRDLLLLGLVGLQDPPRPEARQAIDACRDAGVAVKMITGDHPRTAQAIARQLGLAPYALTGTEIQAMTDAQLGGAVGRAAVFARVAPEQKVRIVRALHDNGLVVAMTGDGVNDAPALKTADIGIAMGRNGTEVSRQAASMVLADDNFASIVSAVREGRVIYDNIRKFVRFQLSTNVGAILTVAGATALGWPVPFTPIQLLWVNVIMDGPPAIALALDPARPGLMREPPRPVSEQLLSTPMLGHLLFLGSIMAGGTLLAFHLASASAGTEAGLTTAFMTFVLFQVFNAFNVRDTRRSVFARASLRNGKLMLALALVLAILSVALTWAPARAIFDTVVTGPAQWLLAAGIACSVLLLEEARKWVVRALPGSS